MDVVSEWQPIESAPKDGSTILLLRNLYPVFNGAKETDRKMLVPACGMWSTWDGAFRCFGGANDPQLLDGLHYHKPTHWLPIPGLPQ